MPLIINSTSERGLTLAEIVVDIQLQNRSDFPEENLRTPQPQRLAKRLNSLVTS